VLSGKSFNWRPSPDFEDLFVSNREDYRDADDIKPLVSSTKEQGSLNIF
jgi:hypothetical protein